MFYLNLPGADLCTQSCAWHGAGITTLRWEERSTGQILHHKLWPFLDTYLQQSFIGPLAYVLVKSDCIFLQIRQRNKKINKKDQLSAMGIYWEALSLCDCHQKNSSGKKSDLFHEKKNASRGNWYLVTHINHAYKNEILYFYQWKILFY